MKFPVSKSFACAFLIGIAILIYISTKACISSFTHDESYTYLHYVHDSFMDIISYKGFYTNNHILNSLLMKCSELLFGNSEWALRFPNLLLFVIYMSYCYLLFKETNWFLCVALFILLTANISLVDLFGLARGYGLSFGFMLMSLYHFIKAFDNRNTKNIILFHAGALLAVLSNFTLLAFYIASLIIYNIMILIECKFISNKKYNFFTSNKIHGVCLLPVTAILYEPVRRIIKFNNIDFGGKNSFYGDTVTYFINNVFYYANLSSLTIAAVQILFTAIVLLSLIIIFRMILKRNEAFFRNNKGFIISCLLIVLISVVFIFLHVIFGADYPIGRFAAFLYPVFIIHFGFLLNYGLNTNLKKMIPVFALVLALISGVNFYLKANLYACSEWQYDMETKNMIQKLTSYKEMNEPDSKKIILGINWLFEPTINFYRDTKNIDWLMPAGRNGITKSEDYYYIFKDELSQLNPLEYEVIFEFKRTNTWLLKNKKDTKNLPIN